jgi:O-antigen ligase
LRSYLLTLAKNRRLSMLVVLLSAVVVLSGALFATLSRGAILGFLASLLFFIATAGTRRSQRGRALVVIVVAAVLSLVGLVAAWDRIEDRFSDIAEENRIVRPAVWADTMRVVRAYPVLGSGLGTFERSFPRYQSGYTAVRFEHAESDYLEVLAETGVLGATLAATTLVAFFSTAISAWRRRRGSLPVLLGLGGTTSCLAISVHGLTDFNLRIPANAFLLAVVAGLTVVVLSRGGRVGRSAAGPGMPDQAEVA